MKREKPLPERLFRGVWKLQRLERRTPSGWEPVESLPEQHWIFPREDREYFHFVEGGRVQGRVWFGFLPADRLLMICRESLTQEPYEIECYRVERAGRGTLVLWAQSYAGTFTGERSVLKKIPFRHPLYGLNSPKLEKV